LTAGAVNTNLMDQAVMVFADAAARTAALGSPSEGMVTYLEDTDSLQLYTTSWGPVSPAITPGDLPAGSVLQVVSTALTSVYSESMSENEISSDVVTGLTAAITPVSASSKIRVDVSSFLSSSSDFGLGGFVIRRGSTAIGVADAAGNRARLSAGGGVNNSNIVDVATVSQTFIDSPSSTAELTYGISLYNRGGAQTAYVNRASSDINVAGRYRTVSTITLTEVAG